jgi:hypothetical protein
VIAAGIGDHSALAFVVAQRGDLVVGSTELKGTDRLQVFKLEEEPAWIAGSRPFDQGSVDGNTVEEGARPLDVS